ncbi:MAG: flagellar assembly protein A [Fibrobacterota bacterium]
MKISLTRATPGMKLSQDVIQSGTLILRAPVTLTSELINILNKHGVQEISIDQPATDSPLSSSSPLIAVSISEDEYRADILIKPTHPEGKQLTKEDLYGSLRQHNVCSGIHDDKLRMLVERWNHSPAEYSVHGVATGSPPAKLSLNHIEVVVSHISRKEHLQKAQRCTRAWELKNAGIPFQRVKAGQAIAHIKKGLTETQGMTVTGKKIKPDLDALHRKVNFDDESISFIEDTGCWQSLKEGVAYFIDNQLGVLPVSFDGNVDLFVAPDRLTAEVVIHPALEGGKTPSEDSILNQLREQGITFGIRKDVLSELSRKLGQGITPEKPIIVVEGKPPVDGENGSVTFFFNTETSLKPQQNPDGTVDYKNVNLIHRVSAGDKLAGLTPPTRGNSGRDIYGKELAAKDGIPATLPAGPNTRVSDEEENVLIATVDGNVKFNGTTIEVSEGFVVKEDVDFGTGNVSYAKSVMVGGDVKSGFSVECGGDLQVGGTIEDAHVKTGGHVLCKYGFIGQGKGIIEAHGDVNLGFLKNQTIRCRGRVNIAREALNGNIFARKSIIVGGNHLSVAGGLLMARDLIRVRTAGNTSGIRTILEVGTDFTLIEELQKTESKISEIQEIIAKLEKTSQQYIRLEKTRKLPQKELAIYEKIKVTLVKYEKEITSLEKRKELITRKIYNYSDACVRIDHSALPGTIIKIGERQHIVREEVIGPKVARFVRHEIRIA